MANSTTPDARHLQVVGAYYQSGEEALLGPMLSELRELALAYLRGTLRVRDAKAAADVAQEALSTLLGRLRAHTFTPTRPPGVLLCVLCRYAILSRKRDPSEPGVSEEPYQLLPASTATPAQELPSSEVQAAAMATLTAATHAVLALDTHARAAVVLHYYHGLDAPAAAAKLGITDVAFRERLRRGVAALQAWGRTVASPATEVYAALSGIDTGDLFREPLRLAS